MKTKNALLAIVCFLVLLPINDGYSQLGNNVAQVSFLLGYTPVQIGSNIDHDARVGASFRLATAKLKWDFDVEYYNSSNTWARAFPRSENPVYTVNTQKTSGVSFGVGVSKTVLKSTTFGLGLSGNYFDINQILNESVHFLGTGEETTDDNLKRGEKKSTIFAPGIFLQSELFLPLKKRVQIYLKQKINWLYIGNQFRSSFFNSWISYSVYLGLRFNV